MYKIRTIIRIKKDARTRNKMYKIRIISRIKINVRIKCIKLE